MMEHVRSKKINSHYVYIVICMLFVLILLYSIIVSITSGVSMFAVLPALFLLMVSYYIHYRDYSGSKKYQMIHIAVLVIDLILVIYNSINRDLPFTNTDWASFDLFAKNAIARSDGLFDVFLNSVDFFTACVAFLYKMFGADVTIIYFYILPLSFVLSHYVFKTVFLITSDKKKSMLMSTIILLMPVNFIFSLSVLREIPIQCVSIVSLYHFIVYLKQRNGKNLVTAILFAVLAALMHSGMIAILVVYCYVYMQKKFFGNIKMLRVATIFFGAILLVMMSLPIFSPLTKRFEGGNSISDVASMVSVQNKYLLEASTSYVSSTPDTLGELIISLPYRMFMFVVSPLPWQMHGMGTIVAFFADAVFRYYIVYRIIKMMLNIRKYSGEEREIMVTVFMSIIVFDVVFCLGTTNYGQAMRHRAKMLPFELVLLSISDKKVERINK